MSKPQIGILGSAKGEHTLLLQQALLERGADPHILLPRRLLSSLPQGGTTTRAGDDILERLDGLMVRLLPSGSLEQVIYRLNVLHVLEGRGLRIINSPDVIEKTVDKYYTTALLADAGLPVPRTVVTERYDEAMEAVGEFGSAIVKPVFGSMGKGIVMVDNEDVAHRVFRALELQNFIFYIQEYLPHGGVDYRLFVLGGKVLAAMARHGGWRTNISLGGEAKAFQPPEEMQRLALETTKLLGADYLGVDILMCEGKPYILEANGIPGWTGLQRIVDFDISGAIADYAMGQFYG